MVLRHNLQDFLFALSFFFSCIDTVYSLFFRMHMEEVNKLIQFFVIVKTLAKSSMGLRTCYVYDRVIVAKKICPKDKRKRLMLLKENLRLRSSSRLNIYI